VEFAEHRLHNPGESTKHLDWKLYARTDKMFVKRYEEETNLRCQIVMDASRSMAYPDGVTLEDSRMSKLKFSVLAAAALTELFRRQRDAVGLSLFSEALDLQTPARSSRAHHRMLFDKLEGLLTEPSEPRQTSAVDALHQVAEATPRRSLILVFSDLLDRAEDPDALLSALQHLRHNKHEVVVFHVLDATTEVDFEFPDRPTRFVDLETGEELKLHPSEVRENYTQTMAKLRKTLSDKCGAYGIDWVDVDVAQGVLPVLSAYLTKRAKLF
jgi:uncharacterized protein (DUF58 family)